MENFAGQQPHDGFSMLPLLLLLSQQVCSCFVPCFADRAPTLHHTRMANFFRYYKFASNKIRQIFCAKTFSLLNISHCNGWNDQLCLATSLLLDCFMFSRLVFIHLFVVLSQPININISRSAVVRKKDFYSNRNQLFGSLFLSRLIELNVIIRKGDDRNKYRFI